MQIGANVSRAGGLVTALVRGAEMGGDAIQFFLSSPRAWAIADPSPSEANDFVERRHELGIARVVIHASYLINLASNDPAIYQKSVHALGVTMRGAAMVGADGVVLHPGSHRGAGLAAVLESWQTGVREACRGFGQEVPLWLENTAGAGGTIGETFEELALLRDALGEDQRVGFCLDTQHLFAAGWDLRDADARHRCQDLVRALLGEVACIHFNDSLSECGSHRDRHANIDCGEIGGANLAHFIDSRLSCKDIPVILEVPGDGSGPRAQDVSRVRSLFSVGE